MLGVIKHRDGDLEITTSFASEWDAAIGQVKDDPESHLSILLDGSDMRILERGGNCLVTDNAKEIARWPSQAALVADLAAASLLQESIRNWDDFSYSTQDELLSGLRIFLNHCPNCSGRLSFSKGGG
jgi:hypothetical protein